MSSFTSYHWNICSWLLVALWVACIAFTLLSYVSNTLEKQQVLSEQQESIAFMKDWKGQLATLESQQVTLTNYVSSHQGAITRLQEFPSIIEYLFTSARRANVQVTKITPTEAGKNGLVEQRVVVECEGGYHGIASLINGIEQSRFMARVDRLQLEQSDNGNLASTFEVVFILQGGPE